MAKRNRPPAEVSAFLRRCSPDLLSLFSSIKNSPKDQESFSGFVREEIEICKDVVLKLPEKDPMKLAIEKSFERGRVQAFSLFLYAIEFAKDEMNRRIEEEK